MKAPDTLTNSSVDANALIAEFIKEWVTPLDQLAQAIFFHPEFRKSLVANTTEKFLLDRNGDIITECIAKSGATNVSHTTTGNTHVILHTLFKPIFDLLMRSTNFLWGGINYWDTIANNFYSEQFIRPDIDQKSKEIFQTGMQWMLHDNQNNLVLPLTTFMFENCKPPRQAAVFAKEELNHQKDPAKLAFYDLVGYVELYDLRDKERTRQNIHASPSESATEIILGNYLKVHRPKVSVNPSAGVDVTPAFRNLFKFLDLITPNPGWRRVYYISARLKPEAKVAGLLLATESEVDQTIITFVQFFLSRISSFIEYVISSYEMRRHAIRSAIAAIMGRNMSHNIGSHVLARISTPQTVSDAVFEKDFLEKVRPFLQAEQTSSTSGARLDFLLGDAGTKAQDNPPALQSSPQIENRTVQTQVELATRRVALLNAFLRMRMDFVADIATALKPPSPMRISFLGEVLLPFAKQLLLWKNLCGSQNITENDISFKVATEDASTIFKAGKQESPPQVDAKLASIAVGITNGALGCQAFYSIVENFVRNTVKHSKDRQKKKLQVSFDFVTEDSSSALENFFKVTISDDWGACNNFKDNKDNLTERLNRLLKQPLITDNGSLLSSNRGLKEMKAAASYLRGLLPESLEDDTLQPPLLKAVADQEGNLGYEFYMLKPKELLIVQCGASLVNSQVRPILRKQGVEIVSTFAEAAEKAPAYSMLFILDADERDITKFLGLDKKSRGSAADTPIRIFIKDKDRIEAHYGAAKESTDIQSIQPLYDHFLSSLKAGSGMSAATDLRELWMRLICGEPQTELWIAGNMKNTAWNVAGLSRLVSKQEQPGPDAHVIMYAHHGFKHRENNVAFYEPYSGGGVDPISFIIDNPPQTEEARRALIYQLIEAGALPIYILDERIQEAAAAVQRSFSSDLAAGEHRDMIYWLRLMRVYVPTKEELDLEGEDLSGRKIENWLEATIERCQIGCRIPPVLVIHQGLLDGINLSDATDAQNWIGKIKGKMKGQHKGQPKICEVIITSGRGIPDNIPPQTRFVPLSTVALYTVERKSKFHLVKALMASRRARGGGVR